MYPNLKAECGINEYGHRWCGIHPDNLSEAANITLELFNAAVDGTQTLTEAEAKAIADRMGVTVEYLFSPVPTLYYAETDAQKDELYRMQNTLWDYCDKRNFDYSSEKRSFYEEPDDMGRKHALPAFTVTAKALIQPITYAAYRYLCGKVKSAQRALEAEQERRCASPPRGIGTTPGTTTQPMLNELTNDLTEELTIARVCLERAETMLSEVCEEYFNETTNNPKTPKGRENILLYFDENRVHSWIARDYLIDLHKALDSIEAVMTAGV